METAARVLNSSKASDPLLLQNVEVGIQVEMPTLQVRFNAVISDSAAILAGCKVAPESYVLPAGTEQVFSCFVVDGWEFTKWQIDGTDVAGDMGELPVALLTIPNSPTIVTITAVVAPV
jgi:hypothetical protein